MASTQTTTVELVVRRSHGLRFALLWLLPPLGQLGEKAWIYRERSRVEVLDERECDA